MTINYVEWLRSFKGPEHSPAFLAIANYIEELEDEVIVLIAAKDTTIGGLRIRLDDAIAAAEVRRKDWVAMKAERDAFKAEVEAKREALEIAAGRLARCGHSIGAQEAAHAAFSEKT